MGPGIEPGTPGTQEKGSEGGTVLSIHRKSVDFIENQWTSSFDIPREFVRFLENPANP